MLDLVEREREGGSRHQRPKEQHMDGVGARQLVPGMHAGFLEKAALTDELVHGMQRTADLAHQIFFLNKSAYEIIL